MGRWKHNEVGSLFRDGVHVMYQDIEATINADCDAYEQRIAELTTELALVKAESLRVVPEGDARYWHCCEGVCLYDDGEPMLSFEGQYGSYSDRYPQQDTIVQPVRLELWDRPC